MTVPGDNPIKRKEDDVLDRTPLAHSFAKQILALDASEGIVVGVLGAWGFGKTSFVNLTRAELQCMGATILEFNPWMFSGAEQLIDKFFIELAGQLRIKSDFSDIAKGFEEYGESFSGLVWLPVVGVWIDRFRGATKALNSILQRRKEGVGDRRAKLEKILALLDHPIIVVLDDIDRLSTVDIKDVFKLVRLTASFPNFIYILAFDRLRVERALEEDGIPGRAYLEKILQVAIDLPAIPSQMLNRHIFDAINGALDGIENHGPFDADRWSDIFMEIVHPLIRNLRDVRRYAATIHGTVASLDGRIALVDILALEAVRIFMPDVFAQLHRIVGPLTTISNFTYGMRQDPPHLKTSIDALIQAGGDQEEIVRSMIRRLFPTAERHISNIHHSPEQGKDWLRKHRAAHEDILRLYLERVAGDGMQAFTDAEIAWAVLANREALDCYLRSLDIGRLEEVISSLETFEDEFAPEHVVPGTTVLLNLLPDLPERQRDMFGLDAGTVVGRITYRLLRTLATPESVEAAVRMILPELTSLSAKWDLITSIGHREGSGHKFVTEEMAARLEKEFRAEVRSASSGGLAREKNILRILLMVKREAVEAEPLLEIPDEPEVMLAILQGSRSEVRQQSVGSRTVRRLPRIAWESLIQLFGGEEMLRKRIECLKETHPDGEEELIALVGKYAGGWRPKDFGDE